jgi:hypothetical protein
MSKKGSFLTGWLPSLQQLGQDGVPLHTEGLTEGPLLAGTCFSWRKPEWPLWV